MDAGGIDFLIIIGKVIGALLAIGILLAGVALWDWTRDCRARKEIEKGYRANHLRRLSL